ncbi:MAG: PQQ-binding-like beta-propeller repeat protein [Vicinamibacterales bacterium]
MTRSRMLVRLSVAAGLVMAGLVARGATQGQAPAAARGEWRTYGGDLASTRYSPLDQITAENFGSLRIAWRFRTDNFGPRPEIQLQATPLYANGALYAAVGTRRTAVSLDPASGELLWNGRVDEKDRRGPRVLSGRGVAYWESGAVKRVYMVTPGYQLVAFDAATGQRASGFGTGGIVDLRKELGYDVPDLATAEIGLHSAPIVANDVIVIGAAHLPGGAPPTKEHIKGVIRGYDARTGKRLWTFTPIPGHGEKGNDTWLNESWTYTGNAGSWAQMSADEQLGLVYVPVEAPTGDYYGGHRPGNNLYSSGLAALNVKTGRMAWFFQTTHHDIWDWDMPSAPILADITVDGKAIKAVAVPTKQSWLYVFDRATGTPVWPINEVAVPKGDLPGEWYSPTQPVPSKPPAFDRQGVSKDELLDFTPELRAKAEEFVKQYRTGTLFEPPSLLDPDKGMRGTLQLPGSTGGPNWPGGSIDPETNVVYIYSKAEVTGLSMRNDPRRSNMDFVNASGGEGAGRIAVENLPIIRPPWGQISAIDLNKGEILWQVVHGETDDAVKNHPALKGVTIPRTGRPGRVGVLTTKTLVMAGDSGMATHPNGQRSGMFRAYDKKTGKELGAVPLPGPQTGSPMTYLHNGKQYIVVAVSGQGAAAELVALALPDPPK